MITNYVLKVIRSCKTIEQLDSCEKWINNIKYKQITSTSIFAEFVWILDNSLLPKTWTFTKKDIESFFTKITKKELNIIRLLYEK